MTVLKVMAFCLLEDQSLQRRIQSLRAASYDNRLRQQRGSTKETLHVPKHLCAVSALLISSVSPTNKIGKHRSFSRTVLWWFLFEIKHFKTQGICFDYICT